MILFCNAWFVYYSTRAQLRYFNKMQNYNAFNYVQDKLANHINIYVQEYYNYQLSNTTVVYVVSVSFPT